MRKFAILAAPAAALLLEACGGGGVFGRSRPDEFAVARNAPLVIPPDYNLAPPAPGAPRPQDVSPQTQALQALFGGPAPRSAAERSVLGAADADRAAAGVRSTVGDPDTNVVDKGAVTRDILAAPEGDGRDASVRPN